MYVGVHAKTFSSLVGKKSHAEYKVWLMVSGQFRKFADQIVIFQVFLIFIKIKNIYMYIYNIS
jgi:hypothetical protein